MKFYAVLIELNALGLILFMSSSYIFGEVVELIVLLKGIATYKVLAVPDLNSNLIKPCYYGLDLVVLDL